MKKVFVITGPTASGKTHLTYLISEKIKKNSGAVPVIISADSRQIYTDMPIATAQPSQKFLKKYRHYFINELHPVMDFNAGDFGKAARHIIKESFAEHKIPIVAGGSGLYIRSLIHGLFELDLPESTNGISAKQKQKEIREKLNEMLEKKGADNLYKELFNVDPDAAARMTPSAPRRVIRALEVYYLTGIPISHHHKKTMSIDYNFVQHGLDWERELLYKRINDRVVEMIDEGLVDEVKALIMKGYNYHSHNSLNTVGIKEVFDHLDGKTDHTEMTELIKQNTRRYAKRQMTWFRKDKDINWIKINSEKELNDIAEFIYQNMKKAYRI